MQKPSVTIPAIQSASNSTTVTPRPVQIKVEVNETENDENKLNNSETSDCLPLSKHSVIDRWKLDSLKFNLIYSRVQSNFFPIHKKRKSGKCWLLIFSNLTMTQNSGGVETGSMYVQCMQAI